MAATGRGMQEDSRAWCCSYVNEGLSDDNDDVSWMDDDDLERWNTKSAMTGCCCCCRRG